MGGGANGCILHYVANDRLRLDISYIRNRSLLLDVKILMMTLGAVVSRRGAN